MTGFDADALDEVIHGRLRLSIMAYLSGAQTATFSDIQRRTNATNGNLGTHLHKLEDAGYVVLEKGYAGRRPQTRVVLTAKGREAWIAYLDQLKDLIDKTGG